MVKFEIENKNGLVKEVEVPVDMGLSLMEILKASEYNILATCGGMALCATCHVEVENGLENLNDPTDSEMDMLDTLPDASSFSRLACQIRINSNLEGMKFKLMAEE